MFGVESGSAANGGTAATHDRSEAKITLRLVNAASDRPVPDTRVTVIRDNGIACLVPPCPNEQVEWHGVSDANGRLTVPLDLAASRMHVETDSLFGELPRDAQRAPRRARVVEMLPKATGDAPEAHPLKLIDAVSNRPIGDTPVRLEFTGKSGGKTVVRATTNRLGYVFVPFAVVAAAADRTWIVVPGYRRMRADFAYVRRITRLERQHH
ncbi:MAG: hypothetical protein KGL92_01185 [Gammaproteobacteria bacterium]|nr:hypothetical protein [Gammaproteobacteria bacterium]